MTKKGKCDVCRVRKVACDEGKPLCTPCKLKGRICTYATTSQEVEHGMRGKLYEGGVDDHLVLRTAHIAPIGDGFFYTLASRTGSRSIQRLISNQQPSRPLTNLHSSLQSRWINTLGCATRKDCDFEFWGDWFAWLPSRIGSSSLIDLGASYVLASHQAFRKPEEDNDITLEESAGRAMSALRYKLATFSDSSYEEVLVTINLLCAAEFLRGIGSLNYSVHVTAIFRMLSMHWISGKSTVLDHSIIRSLFLEEIFESIFVGRNSTLEQAPIPDFTRSISPRSTISTKTALDLLIQKMTSLPRFLLIVRAAFNADAPQEALRQQAALLAVQMFEDQQLVCVEQTIQRQAYQVDARGLHSTTPYELPLPRYWQFESLHVFVLAASYYTFRTVICGILMHILESEGGDSLRLKRSSIRTEAIAAVELTAKCVPYALSFQYDVPLAMLKIANPIILSWGLCDLMKRQGVFDDEIESRDNISQNRVVTLQEYCHKTADCIGAMWGGTALAFSESSLREISEVCFGLKPLHSDIRKADKWPSS